MESRFVGLNVGIQPTLMRKISSRLCLPALWLWGPCLEREEIRTLPSSDPPLLCSVLAPTLPCLQQGVQDRDSPTLGHRPTCWLPAA